MQVRLLAVRVTLRLHLLLHQSHRMPHIRLTLDADMSLETHTVFLHLQRLIINILMATRLRPLILLAEITTTGIVVLLTTGVYAVGIIGTEILVA